MPTLAKPGIRNTGQASIVVAVGVALAAAVLALLLYGPVSSAQNRAPEPSAALGTNGASAPKISWRPCPKAVAPGRYQCATARVPLSYRKPEGKKTTLAPSFEVAHRAAPGSAMLSDGYNMDASAPQAIAMLVFLKALGALHLASEYLDPHDGGPVD